MFPQLSENSKGSREDRWIQTLAHSATLVINRGTFSVPTASEGRCSAAVYTGTQFPVYVASDDLTTCQFLLSLALEIFLTSCLPTASKVNELCRCWAFARSACPDCSLTTPEDFWRSLLKQHQDVQFRTASSKHSKQSGESNLKWVRDTAIAAGPSSSWYWTQSWLYLLLFLSMLEGLGVSSIPRCQCKSKRLEGNWWSIELQLVNWEPMPA